MVALTQNALLYAPAPLLFASLTREHTLANVSELRRVYASGGMVTRSRTAGEAPRVVRHDEGGREHRLQPSRTIGDLERGRPNPVITPEPEVTMVHPLGADTEALLLCSDGVISVLSDEARPHTCGFACSVPF